MGNKYCSSLRALNLGRSDLLDNQQTLSRILHFQSDELGFIENDINIIPLRQTNDQTERCLRLKSFDLNRPRNWFLTL